MRVVFVRIAPGRAKLMIAYARIRQELCHVALPPVLPIWKGRLSRLSLEAAVRARGPLSFARTPTTRFNLVRGRFSAHGRARMRPRSTSSETMRTAAHCAATLLQHADCSLANSLPARRLMEPQAPFAHPPGRLPPRRQRAPRAWRLRADAVRDAGGSAGRQHGGAATVHAAQNGGRAPRRGHALQNDARGPRISFVACGRRAFSPRCAPVCLAHSLGAVRQTARGSKVEQRDELQSERSVTLRTDPPRAWC